MIFVVFRSRKRPNLGDDYSACNKRMNEIAKSLPGFISVKGFTADDGESVSIHLWETAEQLRVWVEHPEHLEAKERGRREYYEDYTCYICEDPRQYGFSRQEAKKD
jgi:heme-degrading monooxygenase HmoA